MSKKLWLSIAGVASVGVFVGAITVFGWMIDETHFDRPDPGFDRLAAQVEEVPGVTVDAAERWVEAPTFSDPKSWIQVTLDQASFPAVLDAACSTRYPDTVGWSLRARTDGGNVVSVHSDTKNSHGEKGEACPDFGFDVPGLIGEVDGAVRGLELQAAVWENGRFALVATEDASGGLPALLPLVAHAEDLRDAAGVDSSRSVEINASQLGLVVEPGEQERYFDVLTGLVAEHGVSSYWADGGGTQTDGVEKIQIVAPDDGNAEIEDALRTSGLHVADLPVRFIPE